VRFLRRVPGLLGLWVALCLALPKPGYAGIAQLVERGRTTTCQSLPAPHVYCQTHLRYSFVLRPKLESRPHVIIVSNFRGNPLFQVNGRSLSVSTTTPTDQVVRGVTPIRVPITPAFLKTGANELEFILDSTAVLGPYPGDILVAEVTEADRTYRRLYATQVALARVSDGLVFALVLVAAGISLVVAKPIIYLCFIAVGLSFLASSVVNLLPFALPSTVATLLNYSTFIGTILFAPMVLLASNYRIPAWLWGLCLALPMSMYVGLFTVDDHLTLRKATLLLWVLTLLMALYGLTLAIFRGRSFILSNAIWIVLGVIVVGYALGRIDGMTSLDILIEPVNNYAFLTAVLALGAFLVRRFLRDFVDVIRQEHRLKDAVAMAQDEIRVQTETQQHQRDVIARQTERDRLMTDLHDGVAGHLLSISALAGSAEALDRLDTIQRVAKSAIVDLRLIVDSLDEYSGELLACLTQFRRRVDQLMGGTGMQVEWALSPALIPAPISQESALNLVRILQEMIHNAIRHSGGSRIQIDVMPAGSESVRIRCRDDGRLGPEQTSLREGTGIRNMRSRAERLGVDLEVCVSDAGGVEITLRL
ncbi:MAG: hypothetical protein EB075_11940, partial [Bacteroidetes bacterium]|nr:hypothetical protein [Bacteroidota bacterium]